MVIFNKKEHTYTKGQSKYLSVTTFIKKYCAKFEEGYWLKYKTVEACMNGLKKENGVYAKKKGFFGLSKLKGLDNLKNSIDKDLYAKVRKEIKQAWKTKSDTSAEKGTAYHDNREKEDLKAGEITFEGVLMPVFGRSGEWDNSFREIDKDGCYLEYLVFSDETLLAGQIDKLIVKGNTFKIIDYKTNENLHKPAFDNKKMLPPFDFLDDSKIGHYTLQLNIYAALIEQRGFVCEGLEIHYFDEVINVPKYDIWPLIKKELV